MAEIVQNLTWQDGVKVSKAAIRTLFRDRVILDYSAVELRLTNTNGTKTIRIDGTIYFLDAADVTTVDNGSTVIVSADGGRYKPVSQPSTRNHIINGNFDIWQRGTSFPTPGGETVTADRWKIQTGGGVVSSVSRQAITPGDVPGAAYSLRISVSAAGDIALKQNIEDVHTLEGQSVVLSFWVKASNPTVFQAVFLIQSFGIGGSANVNTIQGNTTQVGVDWVRVSLSLDLPSIVGKTVGPGSVLQVRIDLNQSFVGDFDISQVKLEAGAVATPFVARPPAQELALCQRYFEKSAPIRYLLMGGGLNAAYAVGFTSYKVTKRAPPTVAFDDGAGNANKYWHSVDGPNQAPAGGSVPAVSDEGGFSTSLIHGSAGNWIRFNWSADAEL